MHTCTYTSRNALLFKRNDHTPTQPQDNTWGLLSRRLFVQHCCQWYTITCLHSSKGKIFKFSSHVNEPAYAGYCTVITLKKQNTFDTHIFLTKISKDIWNYDTLSNISMCHVFICYCYLLSLYILYNFFEFEKTGNLKGSSWVDSMNVYIY